MSVSIMDLGSYGAFYSLGWECKIAETGERAKKIINHDRIYPPQLKEGLDKIFESVEPLFKAIDYP